MMFQAAVGSLPLELPINFHSHPLVEIIKGANLDIVSWMQLCQLGVVDIQGTNTTLSTIVLHIVLHFNLS